MAFDIITALIIIGGIIGLISIFIGTKVYMMCSGNLKTSILLLMTSLILLILEQVNGKFQMLGGVLGVSSANTSGDLIANIIHTIAILSIFLSLFNFSKIVDNLSARK